MKRLGNRKESVMLSFLLFYCGFVWGQVNVSGKSGLIYVPSATLSEDGSLRLGVAYNPINYGFRRRGRNAERIVYATLTVLPGLEVNINFLQLIGTKKYPVREALGDRQLDLRWVVLKETSKRPSLALIMSSPFTIDAALLTQVVVATKGFDLSNQVRAIITIGVGSPYFVYRDAGNLTSSSVLEGFKWQKKSDYRYNNHYLEGPFGGIQLELCKKAGLMLEYDSKHLNMGAYVLLFDHWNVQAGLINVDEITVGTSYRFSLLKSSKKLKALYEANR